MVAVFSRRRIREARSWFQPVEFFRRTCPLGLLCCLFSLECLASETVLERGNGSLYENGRKWLEEIQQVRVETERARQAWTEETLYLRTLVDSLKSQNEMLSGRLEELSELVDRREAAWRQLEEQAERSEELRGMLAAHVDEWIRRLKLLVEQGSEELARELRLEFKALERHAQTEANQLLSLKIRTVVTVLDRLNRFQVKAVPVIEDWSAHDSAEKVVRVIYLGLGAALYQVAGSGEAGWRFYRDGDWNREPDERLSGNGFLSYWHALQQDVSEGVFEFPLQAFER